MKRIKTTNRGAKRMKEQGYRLVAVWLDQSEAALVNAAAISKGKKLATWIREAAVLAARETVTVIAHRCQGCRATFNRMDVARCPSCGLALESLTGRI